MDSNDISKNNRRLHNKPNKYIDASTLSGNKLRKSPSESLTILKDKSNSNKPKNKKPRTTGNNYKKNRRSNNNTIEQPHLIEDDNILKNTSNVNNEDNNGILLDRESSIDAKIMEETIAKDKESAEEIKVELEDGDATGISFDNSFKTNNEIDNITNPDLQNYTDIYEENEDEFDDNQLSMDTKIKEIPIDEKHGETKEKFKISSSIHYSTSKLSSTMSTEVDKPIEVLKDKLAKSVEEKSDEVTEDKVLETTTEEMTQDTPVNVVGKKRRINIKEAPVLGKQNSDELLDDFMKGVDKQKNAETSERNKIIRSSMRMSLLEGQPFCLSEDQMLHLRMTSEGSDSQSANETLTDVTSITQIYDRRVIESSLRDQKYRFAELQSFNKVAENLLAEYFHRKRAEFNSDNAHLSENGQELAPQRYKKYLSIISDMNIQRQNLMQENAERLVVWKEEAARLTAQRDAEWKDFNAIRMPVILTAVGPTQHELPRSHWEPFLTKEKSMEALVTQRRLVTNKIAILTERKRKQLELKETIAEGLHIIDFEQVKIEISTLNSQLENTVKLIITLRAKNRNQLSTLANLREKINFLHNQSRQYKIKLSESNEQLDTSRGKLQDLKVSRDNVRYDNEMLRRKTGLLGRESILDDFDKVMTQVRTSKKMVSKEIRNWLQCRQQIETYKNRTRSIQEEMEEEVIMEPSNLHTTQHNTDTQRPIFTLPPLKVQGNLKSQNMNGPSIVFRDNEIKK